MEEPRRWTVDHPDGGRVDIDGNTWYACDPYPTWYRWDGGELIISEDPPFNRPSNERLMEIAANADFGDDEIDTAMREMFGLPPRKKGGQ